MFEWAASHRTRFDAALMILGMPALVLVAGFAALARAWKRAPALGQDATAVLAIRRHAAHGLVAVASLFGGLILAAALVPSVTD